jgi:uncharacterized protein
MASHARGLRERYGPWAVVAGASEGLGAAYARELAAMGLHVLLIARREEALAALARELSTRHGVETRVLALDLAEEESADVIAGATAGLDVGLLIYNAALSAIGPFLETPLDKHLRELAINCRDPLTLTYTFGQRMKARGRGGMILMSSMSATMGSAMIANYAATKAYNLVLAEGLWEELRDSGVDVMACAPASVATPGYLASQPRSRGGVMTPETVAREALRALGRQPSFIPGASNRAAAFALRRLMPRRATVRMMGGIMRRMYPPQQSA